jgi:hypothetical protein
MSFLTEMPSSRLAVKLGDRGGALTIVREVDPVSYDYGKPRSVCTRVVF